MDTDVLQEDGLQLKLCIYAVYIMFSSLYSEQEIHTMIEKKKLTEMMLFTVATHNQSHSDSGNESSEEC